MTTLDGLRTDPRVAEAERRLKEAGISDAWWTGLVERIADIPRIHDKISRETTGEAADRRARLAERMRALARDLADDIDARLFVPMFVAGDPAKPELHTYGRPEAPILSLGDWLAECADVLESIDDKKKIRPPVEDRVGFSLRSFAILRISQLVEFYLEQGRTLGIVEVKRAKRKEAALLAAALLDDDTITGNTVTQRLKGSRRKYYKDE